MYVVQGEIGGGLYDGDKGSLRTVAAKMWASGTASGGHQRLADPPPKKSAGQQCGPCGPELALHTRPMMGKAVRGQDYLVAPVRNTYGRNILRMSCHRHGAEM
jgi:hypothetical protein